MTAKVGVNLFEVYGISEVSVVELISEAGTNMKKWKNGKNFSAWFTVVPNYTLRMCASTLSNCKSSLVDYSKKMKARLGKKSGIIAVAHKCSQNQLILNWLEEVI